MEQEPAMNNFAKFFGWYQIVVAQPDIYEEYYPQGDLLNQITIEWGLYNDDGHLINEDGDLINDDGHLISEDGDLINDDGHIIDADGDMINDDGEKIDENGNVIVPVLPE
jgi:hypothetical protein